MLPKIGDASGCDCSYFPRTLLWMTPLPVYILKCLTVICLVRIVESLHPEGYRDRVERGTPMARVVATRNEYLLISPLSTEAETISPCRTRSNPRGIRSLRRRTIARNLDSAPSAVDAVLLPMIFVEMGPLLFDIGMYLHLTHTDLVKQLRKSQTSIPGRLKN